MISRIVFISRDNAFGRLFGFSRLKKRAERFTNAIVF
jgi:hypothetical protein